MHLDSHGGNSPGQGQDVTQSELFLLSCSSACFSLLARTSKEEGSPKHVKGQLSVVQLERLISLSTVGQPQHMLPSRVVTHAEAGLTEVSNDRTAMWEA